MKKIINSPETVVEDMLRGIVAANPQLALAEGMSVIYRKEMSKKVGLVSGGGSGHEPAHAGYVGRGMLDAAVSGNVFSSPDPERILEAIKRADSGKGVLLIIKNYSGDCMNFTMAQELAEMEDIEVDYVIVRDDVAVEDSLHSTGRRGIAGTVFVHKICGAMAETGGSLEQVKAVAEKTIANVRSIGMALSSCTIPAIGKPGFALAEDEMEIGMGIHGEPGVGRCKIMPAKELAEVMLDRIIRDFDKDGGIGGEVSLMVNGYGATPLMELFILNAEVGNILHEKGVTIYKTYVGNYMTALDMAGSSITLLRMDEELKSLLDAVVDTPALKGGA